MPHKHRVDLVASINTAPSNLSEACIMCIFQASLRLGIPTMSGEQIKSAPKFPLILHTSE